MWSGFERDRAIEEYLLVGMEHGPRLVRGKELRSIDLPFRGRDRRRGRRHQRLGEMGEDGLAALLVIDLAERADDAAFEPGLFAGLAQRRVFRTLPCLDEPLRDRVRLFAGVAPPPRTQPGGAA